MPSLLSQIFSFNFISLDRLSEREAHGNLGGDCPSLEGSDLNTSSLDALASSEGQRQRLEKKKRTKLVEF